MSSFEGLEKELLEATNKSVSKETRIERQELCIAKLKKTLETTLEGNPDVDILLELLLLIDPYVFVKELRESVVEYLLKCHLDNENVWHILAQTERHDLCNKGDLPNSEVQKKTPKALMEACLAKYKEGLSKVSSTVKPKLWELYVNFLFDLQEDNKAVAIQLRLNALKSALNAMFKENCLTESYCKKWLTLAMSDGEKRLVLEKCVNACPNSVDLWLLRLEHEIQHHNSPTRVQKIFYEGSQAVKEKGLPLWSAILCYHCLFSDNDTLDVMYRQAVEQPEEIANVIKPQYLEWAYSINTITGVRNIYKTLAMKKPYCKELHTSMINLELMQLEHDYDEWEQVHSFACAQFGKTDVDVWYNYISFCMYNHKELDADQTKARVEEIKQDALDMLSKELIDAFLAKINLLKKL